MNDITWARLLAVEVLLDEPETLGNDALETDLYILRDQLRSAVRLRAHPEEDQPAGDDGG